MPLPDVEMNIPVSLNPDADKESTDFKEYLGLLEFYDDRVYVTVENVCIGIDRYVLNEALRRQKEES